MASLVKTTPYTVCYLELYRSTLQSCIILVTWGDSSLPKTHIGGGLIKWASERPVASIMTPHRCVLKDIRLASA